MGLPDSLTVGALRNRIGKELSKDDTLLGEYLEEAFEAAQAPAPLGCGRLLMPDPAPELDEEGNDTSDPVTKTSRVRGRRVIVPDARELTKVVLDGVELEEGKYHTLSQNGYIVQVSLPHERDWHGYEGALEGDWGGHHDRRRHRTVEVTGRFGFTEIPADLAGGIYILAARAWYEKEAQYADQVAMADAAPVQAYFRQLPPRTKLAFARYTLPTGITGLS